MPSAVSVPVAVVLVNSLMTSHLSPRKWPIICGVSRSTHGGSTILAMSTTPLLAALGKLTAEVIGKSLLTS